MTTRLEPNSDESQATSPLFIAPEPGRWPALLSPRSPSAQTLQFRRELGLPTDRPVVMTGHQAQVWHPGILAKYLAADAFAAKHNAAAAWLWVDQDVHQPGLVRFPVRRAANGDGRTLRVETWAADGAPAKPRPDADVPTGRRAPFEPAPLPALDAREHFAAPGVQDGLERLRAAIHTHAAAPTTAAQLAATVGDLLSPLVHKPGIAVMSLLLSRTSLFGELVERLRADPLACIRAYNGAVAAHPHERVLSLRDDELPLWHISAAAGSARRKVRIADLSSIPTPELSPRALLLTGLLRMGACDLFIHGTGGGGGGSGGGTGAPGHEGYDRITEQWLRTWLGASATLAPIAVVTATLRLRIAHDGPDAAELRRRQWAAHRALHDPALIGDSAAAARKREYVEQIRSTRRAGGQAITLYKQMHAFLQQVRTSHAAGLRELQLAAEGAAECIGDADIAADRTWAFPLYQDDQLLSLRSRIGVAF